ncbi:glycosyl transferase family 1 [Algibacter marinivivus]|uniref:Glycosyl transferase family 1 n=1 Tax=Algibacter marinivivus TaxID=2100723 RepID=A0A2U2X4V0_9FLAO|nr:glycosyltransferase [Algibacter marinivivus]PWH82802.1 glycosyl transferase family 1 [Algibacter marinivivus]
MKILMVAIPNHHFFQWVNQLKNSGYEVFWFDVTDGGPKSDRINWVKQIKGWKLKWDFPFRSRIKKAFPSIYKFIQKYNENTVYDEFKSQMETIKPDIVHCFEMQLSGLPILSIMEQNNVPFMYSSWGSDVFYFEQLGVTNEDLKSFYNRVDYLITDCKRDYKIAVNNGFNSAFLGVFPGNGGLEVDVSKILPVSKRKIILIKGYDDGVGKASIIFKALESIPKAFFQNKEVVVYSADDTIKRQVEVSKQLSNLSIKIYSRYAFIENEKLLSFMGQSCIHIANSISDGMPNALLEAMAMGAFPIQSNPGQVTEEVVEHNKNGLLISNPNSPEEIAVHIQNAINNETLRKDAQNFNINYIQKYYNRATLQPEIQALYESVNAKSF